MIFTRAEIPDDRISVFGNWRIIATINDRDMTAPLVEPATFQYYPSIH
jgi:hypothetical protein